MKRYLKIGFNGAGIGIVVGYLMALIFSWVFGSSSFYASRPGVVDSFNNSLTAATVSTGLWALIGLVFGFGGLIFDQEQWSITKQTVIHLLVTYVTFTPLAILCGWFPLNLGWIGIYTLIFIAVYVAIWSSEFQATKREIRRLNRLLKH